MTSTYNLPLYDAREHTTNNVVAKVRAQAINEEFNPWVQELDHQNLIISYASRHSPQVCRS